MAMAKSKNFAAPTVEETAETTETTTTTTNTVETGTVICIVVMTDDVDAQELLIAERFSDPDILAAIMSRLQATGTQALVNDVGVVLIEQRKNKYDEYFGFLPKPVRNAIHWTANKIEFAFEGGRDWLVDAFDLTIGQADAITGAVMGGVAVVVIYLILRALYRRWVRYRLRRSSRRNSGGYGGSNTMNNNDESRPLYRDTSETRTTTKGGQTTREYSSSQQYGTTLQYGTTPPLSRGYYGAGAVPGRR